MYLQLRAYPVALRLCEGTGGKRRSENVWMRLSPPAAAVQVAQRPLAPSQLERLPALEEAGAPRSVQLMGTGFRARGLRLHERPARARALVARRNGASLGMGAAPGDKFSSLFSPSGAEPKLARSSSALIHVAAMPLPTTPALTTDCVVFDAAGRVLLIRRKNPPFKGSYALPGGFVAIGETAEAACRRELEEETGLEVGALELIGVYSEPERDPRGHTCSIAFLARVDRAEPEAGDDAAAAEWVADWRSLKLAFDHARILADAERLRRDGV
jgi:8-oxo-dGTP diphosphatase